MQLCTRSGGSNGFCGSVALNCSDGSGGLMSLLDLFVLVDLVCQLVFWAILLHPKEFSNGNMVQNVYQNELDDPKFLMVYSLYNESMDFGIGRTLISQKSEVIPPP